MSKDSNLKKSNNNKESKNKANTKKEQKELINEIESEYDEDLEINVETEKKPITQNKKKEKISKEKPEYIHKETKKIIKNIDKTLSFHELKVKMKKGQTIICFDLQVPYDFKLSNEEIYKIISQQLKIIKDSYRASITFDRG